MGFVIIFYTLLDNDYLHKYMFVSLETNFKIDLYFSLPQ